MIEPSDHHGVGESIGAESRKLEGKAIHPVERQKPVGFVRRVYLLFRRERVASLG